MRHIKKFGEMSISDVDDINDIFIDFADDENIFKAGDGESPLTTSIERCYKRYFFNSESRLYEPEETFSQRATSSIGYIIYIIKCGHFRKNTYNAKLRNYYIEKVKELVNKYNKIYTCRATEYLMKLESRSNECIIIYLNAPPDVSVIGDSIGTDTELPI